MADPKYTQQTAPDEVRTHPYPPPSEGRDPRAPRTAGISAAASGALPPEEDSGPHHPHTSPVPDSGYADEYRIQAPPGEDFSLGKEGGEGREGAEKGSWGFGQRMHELGTKAAEPINAMANKVGSQAFLPSTMDRECDKAASIILRFCGP